MSKGVSMMTFFSISSRWEGCNIHTCTPGTIVTGSVPMGTSATLHTVNLGARRSAVTTVAFASCIQGEHNLRKIEHLQTRASLVYNNNKIKIVDTYKVQQSVYKRSWR